MVSEQMSEDSDELLLQRFLSGNESGLTELVERYQKDIFRFTYRLVGNESDAADLSQKVFVNLFLKASSYRGSASFKTWLFQIAVNQCKNHFRSNDRRRLDNSGVDMEEFYDTEYDVTDVLYCKEQKHRLSAAINTLPARQRAVMKLRINMDCTLKETAEIMAISVGTAKAHFHQAVLSLKNSINEQDYETH